MRREYSRITLEIVSVRVERLQDISEADAKAEGLSYSDSIGFHVPAAKIDDAYDSAKDCYADLWEAINGAGSWDANPWVWCVEFRRIPGC